MNLIHPVTENAIAKAAALLRAGKLVAFPTETVYGLGADATSDRAVAAIFKAKNRPEFNPLIVHVPDVDAAAGLGRFNEAAHCLAHRFWPGPLTLVLNRTADCGISLLASAGLPTLAIRVPQSKPARQLIAAAGTPVAAPSANASGKLSPTAALHVAASLGETVSMILDGGPCPVGVESTVIDCSGERPAMLRPGGLPAEEIEAALGEPLSVAAGTPSHPASPGMLASHYAPERPLRMNVSEPLKDEAWLGFGDLSNATLNLSPSGDLSEAAANLFAFLHRLDAPPHSAIAVSPIPETGLGRAINDRLRRAASDRTPVDDPIKTL